MDGWLVDDLGIDVDRPFMDGHGCSAGRGDSAVSRRGACFCSRPEGDIPPRNFNARRRPVRAKDRGIEAAVDVAK